MKLKANYKLHPHTIAGICSYCGALADSLDHVPPRIYEDVFDKAPHWLVYSCIECNSALGARPLLTVGDRRKYLFNYYKGKYAGILSTPHWSEEELEELGGMLRHKIKEDLERKSYAEERLKLLRKQS